MAERRAISEGTLTILGVTMKTFVLDNGEKVIDADDFNRFMEAWMNPNRLITEQEMKDYLEFWNG